jgi:CTP-dependent riboflavin kinase
MAVTVTKQVAEAETLLLVGEVRSGLGEGAGFTQLDWVRREFLAKLGFVPYPGTFNLHMRGAAWEAAQAMMAREAGIPIAPEAGFCAAKCFHVVIGGCITGAVVFPEVPDYPRDKIEVICAVSVREALGVKDGDSVAVSIVC